jgi:Domain of unknown function (DUF4279)
MSNVDELYFSHIGRVGVDFVVSAKDLDPNIMTRVIQVEPASSAKCGDERKDYKGRPLPKPSDEGFWTISSKEKILSKDVNEHCIFLLGLLLPHQDSILDILRNINGNAYFDILWESSYLYAGTGPILSKEVIKGICLLNASIGFDIYQIEE